MEARKTLLKSFINVEIVQAAAVIFVMVILFMSFKVGSFVVTREEGDTIKARISAIEVGMDKINDNFKEMRKENEVMIKEFRAENKQSLKELQDLLLSRQSEVTQRMIDRQDKYYEDLRDRIEGSQLRKARARGN